MWKYLVGKAARRAGRKNSSVMASIDEAAMEKAKTALSEARADLALGTARVKGTEVTQVDHKPRVQKKVGTVQFIAAEPQQATCHFWRKGNASVCFAVALPPTTD